MKLDYLFEKMHVYFALSSFFTKFVVIVCKVKLLDAFMNKCRAYSRALS